MNHKWRIVKLDDVFWVVFHKEKAWLKFSFDHARLFIWYSMKEVANEYKP